MVITVNGCDWRVNIGCRTRISVVELLAILGVTPSYDLNVVLNGFGIPCDDLEFTSVSNGATLELKGVEISPDGHSSAQRVPHRRGTGGKA
jgi:hypothetical protein